MFDQYGCFGWSGVEAAVGKVVNGLEMKNPAGF